MPVQDLGYPTDCAMFPPPRHQASPPYNMNTLGAFGYGQPGHQGQFAQDYGQFPVTDPGLQQQGATPTCSWPGYFAGGPAAGGMPSAGSRAGSVDDYSGVYTTQAPNTAAGAYASPYHSRPGTMPLHSMQSDYSGTPSVSSAMGHSPLGGSPSPSHMSGMVGMVGANNAAVAQRQQSARPYDWLKKQSYPAAPSSGEHRNFSCLKHNLATLSCVYWFTVHVLKTDVWECCGGSFDTNTDTSKSEDTESICRDLNERLGTVAIVPFWLTQDKNERKHFSVVKFHVCAVYEVRVHKHLALFCCSVSQLPPMTGSFQGRNLQFLSEKKVKIIAASWRREFFIAALFTRGCTWVGQAVGNFKQNDISKCGSLCWFGFGSADSTSILKKLVCPGSLTSLFSVSPGASLTQPVVKRQTIRLSVVMRKTPWMSQVVNEQSELCKLSKLFEDIWPRHKKFPILIVELANHVEAGAD